MIQEQSTYIHSGDLCASGVKVHMHSVGGGTWETSVSIKRSLSTQSSTRRACRSKHVVRKATGDYLTALTHSLDDRWQCQEWQKSSNLPPGRDDKVRNDKNHLDLPSGRTLTTTYIYIQVRQKKTATQQKLNIFTIEWNIFLKILQDIKELCWHILSKFQLKIFTQSKVVHF